MYLIGVHLDGVAKLEEKNMTALTKKRVIEVEIDLDGKDFELKEKDSFAFGKEIKAILESVIGRKISHWGYKKPEVKMTSSVDGKPIWGSVVAYYDWEPKVID